MPPAGGVLCTGDILIDSPDDLQFYENCTEIAGSLTIASPTLVDFTLAYLFDIHQDLIIENNDVLTSTQGLSALTHVGGDIIINNNMAMTSLHGLEGLSILDGGLSITDNHNLLDLNGVINVTMIGGGNLEIARNMALKNLDALSGLHTIAGALTITENALIKELDGLKSVQSIGEITDQGFIEIHNNESLKDLNGFENITVVHGNLSISGNDKLICIYGLRLLTNIEENFTVTQNPDLSWCEVEIIVDALNEAGGVDGEIIRAGNMELDDCDAATYHAETSPS